MRNVIVWALLAITVLTTFFYAGYQLGHRHGYLDGLSGASCEPRRTRVPGPSPDPSL